MVIAITSVAETDPQHYQRAVEEMVAANGNTIRNIAAAHHIETARPPTGLAVAPVVIHWPDAKAAHGNKSGVRAGIWLAIEVAELGLAIGPAPQDWATAPVDPIASAVVISRGAAGEIGMHSVVVLEGTTDRAPARGVAVVLPAWGPVVEAEVSAAVVADGDDNDLNC